MLYIDNYNQALRRYNKLYSNFPDLSVTANTLTYSQKRKDVEHIIVEPLISGMILYDRYVFVLAYL